MTEAVIKGTNAVLLDGPCPFLTCLETGPHGHDVCPDCRAVKFGNMSCPTCRSHWPGGDPLATHRTEGDHSSTAKELAP